MNIRWLYPLLLCLILILQPKPASAQQNGITWDISAGFDGFYKDGTWFPVAVMISNSGPDLRATLSVSFRDNAGLTYRQAIDLPRGAKKRVVVPLINAANDFGNTRINVILRDGATVIRSEIVTLNLIMRSAQVVGLISDEDGALADLNTLEQHNAAPTSVVRLKSVDVPDRLELLQAFNVLFIQAADTTIWTDAQRAALRAWIGDGGALIVGGSDLVTRGLSDFLPATVGGTAAPSNLQSLKAVGWFLQDAERQVPLVQITPNAGAQVLAAGEAGQPLLVRQRYGAGRIFQTAFDLEALRDVGKPHELWMALLLLGWQQETLWTQLHTQGFAILRESLQLPQRGLLSALGLFGFLGVYILIVGPVNYLLLRRFNRREWAYLTIPVWVLMFSIGAYAWGTIGRGSSVLVNQLSVVRVQPEAEQGQALTYLSLFSPTRRAYNLEFSANAFVSDAMSSMRGATSGIDVLATEGNVQVPDLTLDVGGMTLLSVEQPITAPKVAAVVREVNGQQQMTLRNLSNRRLTDIVLVRGDGRTQEIAVLEPGAERAVTLNPDRSIYEQLGISAGDTWQRQAVVRQLGSMLVPNGFAGVVGMEPAVAPPDIAPAQPMPLPPPPLPVGDDAVHVGAASPDALETWHVLAWQPQAQVEMKLDGADVAADGETLYIWTTQKEQ